MKCCSKCKTVKPLTAFSIARSNKDGLNYACRDCCKAASGRWAKANPEKNRAHSRDTYGRNAKELREQSKTYRLANPVKAMLSQAKMRAKAKGREYALTEADIIIPSHCPILGIPLFSTGEGASPNSPSLDRIDNARGYTADNVVVVSNRANFLKRDATPDELRRLADFYAS